jgi:hypothetical protein
VTDANVRVEAPLVTVKALLLIAPMPRRARDEFSLRARSLTEGFEVSEPIAVAQQPLHGGQYLGVQLRIFPAPRTVSSSHHPVKAPSAPPPYAPLSESVDILITISPMPCRRADKFDLRAQCLTSGFEVDAAAIGQSPVHGGQSVTIAVRVYPEKPIDPPPPPDKGRWDDGWPESAEDFGRAVRVARTDVGLSKAALSRLIRITDVTLRRIERGGLPSPATRAALVQALSKKGPIHQ